jgi:hypothetical protein
VFTGAHGEGEGSGGVHRPRGLRRRRRGLSPRALVLTPLAPWPADSSRMTDLQLRVTEHNVLVAAQ